MHLQTSRPVYIPLCSLHLDNSIKNPLNPVLYPDNPLLKTHCTTKSHPILQSKNTTVMMKTIMMTTTSTLLKGCHLHLHHQIHYHHHHKYSHPQHHLL